MAASHTATPSTRGRSSIPSIRWSCRQLYRATGLTAAEVAERVARGEVNDVPVRSSRSTGEIVRANVFTRFNALIGILWAIILLVAPIQDSLFGFVIIANTGIGIIQELRAKRTLDGLAVIGEAKPVVRRDGVAAGISTSEIVLGDVVELGPGDKVVVDGEIVEADNLEVDESLLTGEADPVLKRPGDTVMSGSFVVAGGGAFRATKVGREAYAAQLAEEASRFTLVQSELRTGISTILKYVTWMMVPTAIGLIISQLVVKENNFKDSVARTIGGIVPMIPEGLVLLTSVAFAIGVIRLGRKQCLVQELPAIEGLARVDVVCLDKTGTLTEGGMDVTELRPLNGTDEAYVRRVLGALGASDPRPNASLQAIIDAYPDESGWRATAALPFSSARKYSGATFEADTHPDAQGGPVGWLLGAPDVLLPFGDPTLPEIDTLNKQGLRVLLLARVDGSRRARRARRGRRRGADGPRRTGAAAAPGRRRDPHVLRRPGRRREGHLRRQRGLGRRGGLEARAAGRGPYGRRAPTPRRTGRDGAGARLGLRLRPGQSAAEARDGGRAPVQRPHGRDDR